MYAIVDIAGQQFKVEKDRKIYVNRLKAEEGASLSFDKVLFIDNEGDIKIGSPYVCRSNCKGDCSCPPERRQSNCFQKDSP